MSVLSRPSSAILANVVVLAVGVVLAMVGVPTRLSRLKRTTLAVHKFDANFDIAIGVANVTARLSASVGFCVSVQQRHVPVPPGVEPWQEIWLPSGNNHALTSVLGSFRHSTTMRVWYRVLSSRVASNLISTVDVVQKDAALESPSMYLFGFLK